MMNKKLVVTAVGVCLSATGGLAQAWFNVDYDYTLIPYVVRDTNRTTVVTLIGNGQPVASGAAIHLQYWTKSTTDANTAACQPNSSTLTFTDNDIVSFDTAGLLGYPLFGDTTNNAPLGTSISYTAPRHGYLLAQMENGDGFNASFWMEIDLANGGAYGDNGILLGDANADDETTAYFHALQAANGVPGSQNYAPVNFWPASVVSTVFTVTPLGTAMDTNENNQVTVQIQNTGQVQGAYDRNENGVDGTVPQTVRCVGRLTAAQLMPGVVANAAWAASGGWGYFVNLGDNAATTTDRDAVIYQVDTSSAAGAGKFMSNATPIVSWTGLDP